MMMESFIKIKIIILLTLAITLAGKGYSQTTDCIVYDIPVLKSTYINPLNKTADITEFKTIRVNIHFILKSNGTENFTETTDVVRKTPIPVIGLLIR